MKAVDGGHPVFWLALGLFAGKYLEPTYNTLIREHFEANANGTYDGMPRYKK